MRRGGPLGSAKQCRPMWHKRLRTSTSEENGRKRLVQCMPQEQRSMSPSVWTPEWPTLRRMATTQGVAHKGRSNAELTTNAPPSSLTPRVETNHEPCLGQVMVRPRLQAETCNGADNATRMQRLTNPDPQEELMVGGRASTPCLALGTCATLNALEWQVYYDDTPSGWCIAPALERWRKQHLDIDAPAAIC